MAFEYRCRGWVVPWCVPPAPRVSGRARVPPSDRFVCPRSPGRSLPTPGEDVGTREPPKVIVEGGTRGTRTSPSSSYSEVGRNDHRESGRAGSQVRKVTEERERGTSTVNGGPLCSWTDCVVDCSEVLCVSVCVRSTQ